MDIDATFSKTSIIRWAKENRPADDASEHDRISYQAKLANMVLRSVCYQKTLRSGLPAHTHPATVAAHKFLTPRQRIIALLHDTLEDSIDNDPEHKWEDQDLLDLGIDQDIVDGVVTLTHKPGEKYFDYIQRIAKSEDRDLIIVKMLDLSHNSQNERYAHLMSAHEIDRFDKYNVSFHYLGAVLQTMSRGPTPLRHIDASTPVHDFMFAAHQYSDHPDRTNTLLDKFSSAAARLPVTAPTQYEAFLKNEFARNNPPVKTPYTLPEIVAIGRKTTREIKAALKDVKEAQNNLHDMHFIQNDFTTYADHMDTNNIAYYYLSGRLHKHIAQGIPMTMPGTPMDDFMRETGKYDNHIFLQHPTHKPNGPQ